MNQNVQKNSNKGCLGCFGIGCLVIIILAIVIPVGGIWYGLNKFKNMEFVKVLTGSNEDSSIISFAKTLKKDIEVTESDPATGKFTLRNKKTGDWVTITREKIIVNGKEFMLLSDSKLKSLTKGTPLDSINISGNKKADEKLKNIPEWVPLFPGSKIESTMNLSSEKGNKGTVEIKTKATTDSIFAFYSKELVAKGFTVKPEKKSFGTLSWLEINANNKKMYYSMTITVKETQGGRKISIVYKY
jgi:hypothetical protein